MLSNKSSEAFYNKGIIHYEKGEYNLSIDLFKKAIEKNSSNSQYYYNLGLAYVKIEEFDLAIGNFKEAISLNPKDADALLNLGITYSIKSQFNDAIQSYKKALEIKPDDSEIYDNLGIAYFSMKLYSDAIASFKEALNLDSQSASIAYNLAYAYYTNEQYNAAKESFLYVISLNCSDEEAYFNLANTYLKLKELELAKENFEKTLSLCPEHLEAQKALQNLNSSEEPQSEVFSDIVESKDKKIEEHFSEATRLLREREFEAAIDELKNTLALKSDHKKALKMLENTTTLLKEADNLFEQGQSLYSNNEYSRAITCLERAFTIKPNNKKIKELLDKAIEKNLYSVLDDAASTYISKEQYNVAVDSLKKAIEENPLVPENHFNLGKVYIKQRDHIKAVDSLRQTLSLDPKHKEAQQALYHVIKIINTADGNIKNYCELAQVYLNKREYSSALGEVQKILDINPDNAEAKDLFSKIITLMNTVSINDTFKQDLDSEISKYTEEIKLKPNNFEAYYKLGAVYLKGKNYDSAKENFFKALELNPNHQDSQKALHDLIMIMNA